MGVSEEELIEFIKPVLKERGFQKKAKRWTKVTEHFTYLFILQGSAYDKDDYYVRPGVIIHDIQTEPWPGGHISIDIPLTTTQEILERAEAFFSQWTSVEEMKSRVSAFVEWEKRNPLEKRRAGEVDYEADPVPSSGLFILTERAKKEILDL